MPSVWEFIRARKQVRKRDGIWELWVFQDRSWTRVYRAWSWTRVMWVATGDESYRPAGMNLVPKVVWEP